VRLFWRSVLIGVGIAAVLLAVVIRSQRNPSPALPDPPWLVSHRMILAVFQCFIDLHTVYCPPQETPLWAKLVRDKALVLANTANQNKQAFAQTSATYMAMEDLEYIGRTLAENPNAWHGKESEFSNRWDLDCRTLLAEARALAPKE